MKQHFLKSTLLVFTVLLLNSCNKDDSIIIEPNNIQSIKNHFSLKEFNDENIKTNLQIDWDNFEYNEHPNEDSLKYTFSTKFNGHTFIENNDLTLYFSYKLNATKSSTNTWDIELIKFITDDEIISKDISYSNLINFSGTISHFDLKGINTKLSAYQDGVLIDIVTKKNLNLSYKPGPIPTTHVNEGSGGGGSFALVSTDHITDWYKVYPDGSKEKTHSVLNYTTYEYVFVPNNSYTNFHHHSGSTGGGGSSSHGTSNNNNHDDELIINKDDLLIESPVNPIENMEDYLNCFNKTQAAVFTIYVDQPTNNSSEPINGINPGHTYISLKQGNRVVPFGYYPSEGVGYYESVTATMGNNSNNSFDLSVSIPISSSNLNEIINYSINYSKNIKYNLQTNNCSHFGIYTANLAGIPIATSGSSGNWVLFNGANPGALGQYLRDLTLPTNASRNTNIGNSPSNNCN